MTGAKRSLHKIFVVVVVVVGFFFQMKTLYPFITSSDFLYEPPITLGLDLNKDCFGQQVKRISFLQ